MMLLQEGAGSGASGSAMPGSVAPAAPDSPVPSPTADQPNSQPTRGATPQPTPPPAADTVFNGEGFDLVLPAGWVADPADTIAQLNEQAAQLGGPAAAGYLAAFRPGPDWAGWAALMDAGAVPPFALVQVTARDLSSMTPAQVLDAVRSELAEGEGVSFDEPGVADDGRRVWFTGEAPLADGGSMAIATDGLIAPGRVVYLHRYADALALEASADAFETLSTTITLTPTETPEPATGGGLGVWTAPVIIGLGLVALVFVWKAARPTQ